MKVKSSNYLNIRSTLYTPRALIQIDIYIYTVKNLNLVYVHCEKQCTARKLGRSLLAFSRFIDFLSPPFYKKGFFAQNVTIYFYDLSVTKKPHTIFL